MSIVYVCMWIIKNTGQLQVQNHGNENNVILSLRFILFDNYNNIYLLNISNIQYICRVKFYCFLI